MSILFGMSFEDGFSQGPVKNYTKEWKKVEDFTNKNLPKSALAEVKKIYALAKAEKQDAQLIKSLVYMIGLQNENREDNAIFSIAELEKEMASSKEPVTSILKSFQAEIYYNYYQEHRWQLYNRTRTDNFNKTDIATWDAEDFHKKISELYLRSIKEEKLLQQTKLDAFDAIIIKGNMRHLRPTLYDLLVHRALDYFENDERNIAKPAYAFEINQASAFDPAADFITRKFPTKDSFSLEQKALLLYQELIRFHLKDARPDALTDADLQRIQFVRSKSTHPDKDQLYFNAINHIANQYGNLPAAAQAWYLLAAWHEQKANEYSPLGDTTQRFARIKAKEILEKILTQKDSSEGKTNAYNLLRTVNTRSFQFNLEKVNVPGQPFRSLVEYRNIGTLYFKIVKADQALKELLENRNDEKYWPALIAAAPVKTWEQALPATNDLQQHNVEIKVGALPIGEYLMVASSEKDFKTKNAILGARAFFVSEISYVNSNQDYFVLNRDNGKPLAQAAVQVWEQRYDYSQSKYIREKGKAYTTDANGFFRMVQTEKARNGNYSYLLEITHSKDHLFMDEYVYTYYYNTPVPEDKTTRSIHLFTDRSLYRPGQTIYFKGIALLRNQTEKTGIVSSDFSTTVYLRDANYKDVDSIKVTTNEYGSFSGKFQLPQSGLNGQFSIYSKKDNGNAAFYVEEYKRPKFYVEYEPIKGTYKVNDKIKITGIAKAYAGNNIDGATVKYRVVREPRFLYPWLFWRWWQPPSDEMEIAQGEVKTDKDGKFTVEFTAIPDLKIEKKFEPAFDYTVYADVTDINGETRRGEKMVSVSYKSLMLSVTIPATIAADSLKSLYIRTQNMNGEYEPAKVNVVFTKLKEEKRLIRKRYWERPDQFVMNKEEYIRNFPYDEYDNETDFKSWAKGEKAFERSDSAINSGNWELKGAKLSPGFYMIEIETKDKDGQPVKDVKYIELFDEKSNQLNRPGYLWAGAMQTVVEPGETAKIEWGTAADDLFVVQQLDKGADRRNPNTSYSFIKMDKEKRVFDYNITEADRGGFGTGWMFVKHNRFYQLGQTINIPWTNKELKIEYATYRDKTMPGSEEKWKLRITGYKNEKVAAEMLASMYDASLDQFYPHNWSQPYIWPYYYNSRSWTGSQNFAKIESQQRYIPIENYKSLDKRYDEFIASGIFSGYGIEYLQNSNQRLMRMAKPVMAQADMAAPPLETANGLAGKVSGLTVTEEREKNGDGVADQMDKEQTGQQSGDVKIRKNFNETAFFFPDLKTDETGAIEFSFTMPEALTRWKFMALAHTKDAAFGSSTKEIVTQKELMVQPNAPRFMREGDRMEFSSKIVNLTDKEITGTAQFQLFDAATNEPVDGAFKNMMPNQYFTVGAGQSEAVKFPIEVPYLFNKALVWRIVAKAGNYSDGEENMLPVLTNRMLVTESLPLNIHREGSKTFEFTKLLNSGQSSTLQHQGITVEYTSNPAWYAIQSLPYLMEYPYDCAEQTWNRYYANSLATHTANSSPKIQQVFNQWKIKDTAALMSNLQKNQELKAILLEETPWVLQAKNEAEQKRNIALLFDMVKMSQQLNNSFEKLKQMQSSNGGFVWFSGGPDDYYITQYIVTGIGHLKKLGAIVDGQDSRMKEILATAIPYLDRKIKESYDNLIKHKINLKQDNIGYTEIQYLYMRSFFPEIKIAAASQTAVNYYTEQVKQYWTKKSKYMQGMITLALHRGKDTQTPAAILKSLKETSISNEEMGMYWKDQRSGWFWYEAPIETHALLIEAFQEAGKDNTTVDDLRTWLLKNKQTNNWKTTKATAEACYALLLQGVDWLSNNSTVEIKLGPSTTISSTEETVEAGTGYFKKLIEGKKVTPQMGNITVTTKTTGAVNAAGPTTTWGSVYWQYFEDLDKITTASTPLKLVKKLFVEKNTDRGPTLTPVNDGDVLKVGDKIKVRVELRVDRDMEYVHMKDMRASALEPVNVLSQYKYQGGLGYYESTKDASTNFFFSYLRKGTYVFEYPLFVTHTGNFSNGITTIQCMYAPEFTSHSEGVRINVE